ncbi:MAG: nitrate reductase cytochrome c-type subunit [Mariprofundaceae bacterium]|nr:nitrate reductase cytochrome c-type subunit [Mariprofundaceae bacterium]
MKKLSMIALFLISSTLVWAGSNGVHSLRGDVALDASSVAGSDKEWLADGKVNREYIQQPPLVPHDIEDFSINQEGNDCLNCHNWNSEMPGATKIAISHFLTRDNQALVNISPRRYFCTQCHVPQKATSALIGNMFRSLSEE